MTNKKQARGRIMALLLAVSLLFSVASIPVFAEASPEEPGVSQEAEAPGDEGQENGENPEGTAPSDDGEGQSIDPDELEDEDNTGANAATAPTDEPGESGPANRAPTATPTTLGYSSIVAFAPLPEDVAEQEVTTGTPQADLNLPDALAATVEDEDGNQERGDIPVAGWNAAPEYDPQEIGAYTFTPELAAGYTLADGVELPEITVRVFMGIMPTALSDYHEDDVKVINKIITDNGLTGFSEDDPDNWGTFVTWSTSVPKRVEGLELISQSLTGTLDVSGLADLQFLACANNDLTGLDVSGLANLESLNVGFNKLTGTLDVSGLADLRIFSCQNNELTALDVSGLTLTTLQCQNNPIQSLKLASNRSLQVVIEPAGSGTVMLTTYTHSSQTVGLTATQDVYGYNFTGWTGDHTGMANTTSFAITGNMTVTAEFTADAAALYHPDDVAVINAIIDNNNLNANRNDPGSWGSFAIWSSDSTNKRVERLSLQNRNLTGTLDVSGLAYLESLNCSDNTSLMVLDVFSNLALTDLNCSGSKLTALDVSNNLALTDLNCGGNPIQSLRLPGGDSLQVNIDPAASGAVMLTAYTHSSQTVELTARLDTYGYIFDEWTGDHTNTSNPTTFAIAGNMTVTANFTGSAPPPSVGDYVHFGQYGGEDILWQVTSTTGGVTLQSVYVLFDSVYHSDDNPSTTPSLTFETADIYDAVKAIFTTAEQAQISNYGLSPSYAGNGYTAAGVQTTYWTNSVPASTSGEWRVIYAGPGSASVSVTNTHGVRPVITIGGLSEYDSPRIAALTPSDTVFVKGEGRTDPLTVAIEGEAHAGDTLRVRLENSAITEYAHTLTAADLTAGAFDLEWTVAAANLEAHADGIYLLSAELVRAAGTVETVLHTCDGGEYQIYTEGNDLIGANNTPSNTTKVSFGTDINNGGSPAEWYVIETGSGYWTLLAAGRMGTSQFNPDTGSSIDRVYSGSTLYSSVNALQTGFTPEELAAINDVNLSELASPVLGQKLWPLSVDEANAVNAALRNIGAYWWLRSPGSIGNYAAVVNSDGSVNTLGYNVSDDYGIRPAFQLNLASVIFTSDASSTAPAVDTSLPRFSAAATPQNLKLTLVTTGQSSLNGYAITSPGNTNGAQGAAISIPYTYSGSGRTGDEFLRVRLGQSGNTVYTGVIAVNLDTNGTGTAELPLTGVDLGIYDVEVWVEQDNGVDATNLASDPVTFKLTVDAAVDAQTPSITAHPTGAAYTQGNPATALTVAANVTDGGTLSYQWYSNTTNSTSGGTAVGGNSSSYTPSTAAIGTTYYYVVVTNTNNSVNGIKTATATSNTAAVIVNTGGGNPDPNPTLTLGGIDTDTVTIGTYYNITVSTTYTGNRTLAYSISSGSLPDGMTLNAATGSISGTPKIATEGDYPFTITVAEQSGTLQASRSFTLTVQSAPVVPDPVVLYIAKPLNDSIRAGYQYSKTFSVTYTGSETLVYEAQGLPANLSINAATGEITGTPAAVGGPYTITVTVKEASGSNPLSATTTYELTVTPQDNGDNNGGGNNNSGSGGGSSGGGSSTPDGQRGKTQLPASAFSWDGDRTLTISHDSITALGLLSVQWNGKTLTLGTDFTAHQGSVIIRFSEDFIAAQPTGDHTVRVEFLNHYGETTVKLNADAGTTDTDPNNPNTGGDTHNPQTGDFDNSPWWWLVALIPAAALTLFAAAQLWRRLRRTEG